MKEQYLRLAEVYDALAECYRALAESTAEAETESSTADTQPKPQKNKILAADHDVPFDVEPDKVTFEMVSASAKKKATEGHSKEVKAIITECGVKKLSDIPPDMYTQVYEKLEELQ